MDLVTLTCKRCEAALGKAVNAWVQIGKNHISPVVFPDTNRDLDVVGVSAIRNGEPATLVDDCPRGSRGSYQGNSPGDDGTAAGQGSWSALRNDVDARGREIQMLGIAGRQLESYLNKAVVRIGSDIATLKAGLGSLRERQDNHGDDLSDLTAEVSSLRDTVKENQQSAGSISDIAALREHLASSMSAISAVQQDLDNRLSSARGLQALRSQLGDHERPPRENALSEDSYAREVNLLRMEVTQLRNVTAARDYATSQTSHNNISYREELDILIDSVAKFGNRISQVETLKMESKLLKSRVQRLDANSGPTEGAGLNPATWQIGENSMA
ncbi:hypothetical protein PG985_006018 [Apiospora marii]|uniref:uncharacterized protein n=1 Tax=Apiospora marii TaxID=335849 RepID=UPI003131CCEF